MVPVGALEKSQYISPAPYSTVCLRFLQLFSVTGTAPTDKPSPPPSPCCCKDHLVREKVPAIYQNIAVGQKGESGFENFCSQTSSSLFKGCSFSQIKSSQHRLETDLNTCNASRTVKIIFVFDKQSNTLHVLVFYTRGNHFYFVSNKLCPST